MEKEKLADDVMSKDGDCVMLSVDVLYYKVNFNDQTFKMYNKENEKKDIDKNPLFAHEEKNCSAIGSVSGCDYLKNPHNVGYSILHKKVFISLVTWEVEEIILVVRNKTKHEIAADHT